MKKEVPSIASQEPDRKWFLLGHVLTCFIGLLFVLHAFSMDVFGRLYETPPRFAFYDWALLFYFPFKPITTIYYCLSIGALSLYLLLTAALFKTKSALPERVFYFLTAPPSSQTVYFLALLFLNTLLIFFSHITATAFNIALFEFIYWLLIFLIPFYHALLSEHAWLSRILSSRRVLASLVLIMTFHIVLLVMPFLKGPLFIMNEYMGIPSQTRINDRFVNNAAYINDHQVFGFHAYDPGAPGPMSSRVPLPHREHALTPEELSFCQNNLFELAVQTGGWILHHHNFILSPLLEHHLGKSLNEIPMQYGWLSQIMIDGLIHAIGGINVQNYFKALYIFYPLYYLSFLVLLWIIFRRLNWVALGMILATAALLLFGFTSLILAPGFNPIRHFFDLYVIAFLYLYVDRRRIGYLIVCLSFAVLCLWSNKEFGLFAEASLLTTFLLQACSKRSRRAVLEVVLISLFFIIGLYGLSKVSSPDNGVLLYYLSGVGSPSIWTINLYGLFFGISFVYGVFMKFHDFRNPLVPIGLFLFFYLQAALFYYVWNPAPNHFLSLAPLLALLALILMMLILQTSQLKPYEKPFIAGLTAISLVLCYIPFLFEYHSEKKAYDQVFATHKVFQWNFKMAQFQSTMDPAYFTEAVSQIQRYAAHEHGVHIISKYDNLLPFLAEKYSAMPFLEVSWFLVTPNEHDLCVQTIQKNQPTYLFVDTDIERDLTEEIIPDDYALRIRSHDISVSRAQRLTELKTIYDAVKKDYAPVERGLLITVYKRKPETLSLKAPAASHGFS